MKKPELYQRTVDILVDAYFKHTLRHSNCYACAVGNIIAANCGIDFIACPTPRSPDLIGWRDYAESKNLPAWRRVFLTVEEFLGFKRHPIGKRQYLNPRLYAGEAKREIDATGYAWEELAKIEHAFEMAPYGNSEDEWMFNGLMAVIDVLDDVHENTDTAVTATSKTRFAIV